MESSKDIKDFKYIKNRKKRRNKLQMDTILAFVKQNVRYFAAAIIFILIIVAVAIFTGDDGSNSNVPVNEDGVELYQIDAYPEVAALIQNYYTAYANGDLETLKTLAMPISTRELGYISLYSQYVEGYENLTFYTKTGLDSNSYLVNVAVDVKFVNVETLAPGLDFFYVRTNEEGALYIDNLYSTYNLKNMDNPLDTSVHSLINAFEQQDDVIALVQDVTARYIDAVTTDPALDTLINTTLPDAISKWMAHVVSSTTVIESPLVSNTEIETEIPTETETEAPTETETETEAPVVTGFAEGTVITIKETLNVREKMTTDSEKVGVVYAGEKVTVIMSYAEGWTKVKWAGKTGYIRTDLLQ